MGRCGGHALIQWIAENLPGNVEIRNNCHKGWSQRRFEPMVTRNIANAGEGNHRISNIEDFYLPLWHKCKMNNWKEKFDYIITVTRSPKNWLASSIKCGGWANDYLDTAPKNEIELPVSRIDAYIKYLFGDFDFGYSRYDAWFQNINYDKWCQDGSYRELLSRKILGRSIIKKPGHCKFSSFGKNHDYTGDRSLLLNKNQKKRFDNLYKGLLQIYQERYFG